MLSNWNQLIRYFRNTKTETSGLTTETSKALNLCIASFHRWPLFLAHFVPGTALGSQLCVECGNITLPLQGAYKCLAQTTSKGSLLRKGCQNCQNPKLLGQSLIQEQWHRKPQPICGCVWGLGCSTNKGAIAHTRHITTHISNDSAELHSYQMQHSGWRGFALQRHVAATQSLVHIGQTWPDEEKTQMDTNGCMSCYCNEPEGLKDRKTLHVQKQTRSNVSSHRDTRMGNATVWLTAMQSFVEHFGAICFWDYAQQSAMCLERGNITLPLQGAYKFLTQTTSRAHFC